jgi:hypothetical protein
MNSELGWRHCLSGYDPRGTRHCGASSRRELVSGRSVPRRPGGQVKQERPTADDYFRRERRQRMMVRRCQAAHNRDYSAVEHF